MGYSHHEALLPTSTSFELSRFLLMKPFASYDPLLWYWGMAIAEQGTRGWPRLPGFATVVNEIQMLFAPQLGNDMKE